MYKEAPEYWVQYTRKRLFRRSIEELEWFFTFEDAEDRADELLFKESILAETGHVGE